MKRETHYVTFSGSLEGDACAATKPLRSSVEIKLRTCMLDA